MFFVLYYPMHYFSIIYSLFFLVIFIGAFWSITVAFVITLCSCQRLLVDGHLKLMVYVIQYNVGRYAR